MAADDSTAELTELIERARDGDEDALGRILQNHRDWLRVAAEKELDGPLAARVDASDVIQQTFLSACNQIGQFQGGTNAEFAAWLGKIHERNIQDAVRQHVAAQKRSIDREEPANIQQAAVDRDASTPSQRAIRDEQTLRLSEILDRLPADQAEAVRLRHLEGRSLAQIAAQMSKSNDAVASLLKRGVANLRKPASEF